jgi:hypothetical protein
MQTWRLYTEDGKLLRRTFAAWAHTSALANQGVDKPLCSDSAVALTTAAAAATTSALSTAATAASSAAAVSTAAAGTAADTVAATAAVLPPPVAATTETVPIDTGATTLSRRMLHAWREYTVVQRADTTERSVLSQLHTSSMTRTQPRAVSSTASCSYDMHTTDKHCSSTSSSAQSGGQERADPEAVCASSSSSCARPALQAVFAAWAKASQNSSS